MTQKPILAFTALTAIFSGVVAWTAHFSVSVPNMTTEHPVQSCNQPPIFKTGYQRESNGVSAIGKGFDFQGVAWLETHICSSGTLQVVAEGKAANGQDPLLQIGLNSETIASEAVGRRKYISVYLPNPGQLTLGYFNDFYRSDARVATLDHISFYGTGCNSLKVVVPPATGGQWEPESRTASLVSNVPMTIEPCSIGSLSLHVMGQAGKYILPLIEFRQAGKHLSTVQTTTERQLIQLSVIALPVTISLINPYFKELADRNLKLISVRFIPDK